MNSNILFHSLENNFTFTTNVLQQDWRDVPWVRSTRTRHFVPVRDRWKWMHVDLAKKFTGKLFQRMQHVVLSRSRYDSATQARKEMRWIPIRERHIFKLHDRSQVHRVISQGYSAAEDLVITQGTDLRTFFLCQEKKENWHFEHFKHVVLSFGISCKRQSETNFHSNRCVKFWSFQKVHQNML